MGPTLDIPTLRWAINKAPERLTNQIFPFVVGHRVLALYIISISTKSLAIQDPSFNPDQGTAPGSDDLKRMLESEGWRAQWHLERATVTHQDGSQALRTASIMSQWATGRRNLTGRIPKILARVSWETIKRDLADPWVPLAGIDMNTATFYKASLSWVTQWRTAKGKWMQLEHPGNPTATPGLHQAGPEEMGVLVPLYEGPLEESAPA